MLDLYLEDVIPKSLFVCVCTQLYDAALDSERSCEELQHEQE